MSFYCAFATPSHAMAVLSTSAAVLIVQKALRRAIARMRVVAKVKMAYEKVLDPDSGRYFYFNLRTGVSQWHKPKILGKLDIPVTTTPRTTDHRTARPTTAPGAGWSPFLTCVRCTFEYSVCGGLD